MAWLETMDKESQLSSISECLSIILDEMENFLRRETCGTVIGSYLSHQSFFKEWLWGRRDNIYKSLKLESKGIMFLPEEQENKEGFFTFFRETLDSDMFETLIINTLQDYHEAIYNRFNQLFQESCDDFLAQCYEMDEWSELERTKDRLVSCVKYHDVYDVFDWWLQNHEEALELFAYYDVDWCHCFSMSNTQNLAFYLRDAMYPLHKKMVRI